jgi:antitoxin component YwqK of YwqJK toxin-antitoxin module
MKRILAPILLLTFLFPSLAYGVTMDDLVLRDPKEGSSIDDWIYYKKFSDVPFSGKVTGKEQGSFKDGKRVGPWVDYYNNGQLMWKGNFTDSKMDGAWFRYHNNGRLETKGTYKDGKRVGLWVTYHQNGRLSGKGTYKNRKKEGPWVNYNEDGTVWEKYTGTYKNGVKVK